MTNPRTEGRHQARRNPDQRLLHQSTRTPSVMDRDDWITHVSMQGRVVEITDDPDLSGIDALAHHYNGKPYFNRDRPRVDAWVEVDQVHVWGRLLRS